MRVGELSSSIISSSLYDSMSRVDPGGPRWTPGIIKFALEIFHPETCSRNITGWWNFTFLKKNLSPLTLRNLCMNHKRTSVTFFLFEIWDLISPAESIVFMVGSHTDWAALSITIYHKNSRNSKNSHLNFAENNWFLKYQPQGRRERSRRRTQMSAWVAPSCWLSASPSRREGISSKRTGCGTISPRSWCGGRRLPSAWAAPAWRTSAGPRGSWES